MYRQCSYKYKLHYIDKIRSDTTSSALFFGEALDEAFGILALSKKKDLTEKEKEDLKKCPYAEFERKLKGGYINGVYVDYRFPNDKISFFKSDFDAELITEEDRIQYKGYDKHWVSLLKKGRMMIDAYREQVLPLIEEVKSVQRLVNLPNEYGDVLTGFIDKEVVFKDKKETWTVDDKTSSIKYKEGSVNDKGQLLIYDEFAENGQGAYIVVLKKLYKKDPKIRVQIICEEIDDDKKDLYFEEIDDILTKIKNQEFKKDFDSGCFFYGKRCPYYDYCRNGSTKHLVQMKKEEK